MMGASFVDYQSRVAIICQRDHFVRGMWTCDLEPGHLGLNPSSSTYNTCELMWAAKSLWILISISIK